MRIGREFMFEAAHFLPLVPDGHKCRRLHGHSYRVEVYVNGSVRDDGMVRDYADLDVAWAPVHATLDHRCLNDIQGLENPTTENLARWLWRKLELPDLSRIVVRETARSFCEYEGLG